jgi:hypothetical protein
MKEKARKILTIAVIGLILFASLSPQPLKAEPISITVGAGIVVCALALAAGVAILTNTDGVVDAISPTLDTLEQLAKADANMRINNVRNSITLAGNIVSNAIDTGLTRTKEVIIPPLQLVCGRIISRVQMPYVPTAMSRQDLFRTLDDMTAVWTTAAESMGYYFCSVNKKFIPRTDMLPNHYDNPFFLFLHETGLNVIRGIELSNPDYRAALRSLSKTNFMHNGQQVNYVERTEQASATNERKVVQFVFNGELRNQELLIYQAGMIKNFEVLGFILHQQTNTSNIVELGVAFTYQALNDVRNYRLVLTGIKFDRNEMPTQSPTGTVNLAPTNMITDSAGVKAQIGAIAGNPATYGDDVVLLNPVITPDAFPDISSEDFPALKAALLGALSLQDVVMPAAAARDLLTTTVVPRILENIVIPFPPTDLQGILGFLQRLLQALLDILAAILAIPANLITSLKNMEGDDPMIGFIPELPDLDFRMDLMDYFPFSIPRDIVDLVSALSGSTSVQMMGATGQERMILEHYWETGEISPQGIQAIAPLSAAGRNTRPRFEIEIPLPDFSGGTINTSNMTTAYTFVFDLDNHPTLIAIIQLGVYLIFVMGLINITPKVIVW